VRTKILIFIAAITLIAAGFAEIRDIKPGFNLFSPQQDIELGREAAAQVEKEQPLVHNAEISNYLTGLVQRLARSPHAGTGFPFSVKAISDKSVNAFALPGGPLYVYTGLISLAGNEGQLVGVLAHEMSHIKLRHGTNQASKANLIQLPLMLAGGLGGSGILGQLAQVGIGLGANSVLLKMSRTAETQADYNGAQIMAEAGYNPIEMAQLFEKLQAQGGQTTAQFLSDHPNPGNRVKAVQDEIQQMPRRSYTADTRQFARIKDVVAHLPAPGQLRGKYEDGHTAPAAPASRPSGRLTQYQGRGFAFAYPDNWQTFGDAKSAAMVTMAPPDGIVQNRNGRIAIGYGVAVSYYLPESDEIELRRNTDRLRTDTDDLVRQLQQADGNMRMGRQREIQLGGYPAMLTTLSGTSPFQGESEVDQLVTVVRPQGLWYMVFISPESEARDIQPVFDQILRSVKFTK
jgi:beta-barrel assembly-enhancing protease